MSCDDPGNVNCVIPLPSGFIVSMVAVSALQQCVKKTSFVPSGDQSAFVARTERGGSDELDAPAVRLREIDAVLNSAPVEARERDRLPVGRELGLHVGVV